MKKFFANHILAIVLSLSICTFGGVIVYNVVSSDADNTNTTEQSQGGEPQGGGSANTDNTGNAGNSGDTPCTHSYGSWAVVKEPTCTEQGSRERTCTTCGIATESEAIALLSHEYISVGQISDCDGTTLYEVEVCLNCMDIHGLEGAPAVIHPHEFERREPSYPTCTQVGIEVWFECKKCGYDVKQTIPALGHLPGSAAHDDRNNDIYHYHICQRTNCGAHLYDEMHSYTWSVVRKATCTTDGIMQGTCTKCGHVYEQSIPAGHLWENWYLTESNPENPCEHKRVCSRCGLEGYKTEHDFGDFVLTNTNPDNACEHVAQCSRCDAETYETIHAESERVSANNPAKPCEFVNICSRCNREWGRVIDHLWGEWQADSSNPCRFYRECQRCGEIEDRFDHLEGPVEFLAPTCTQDGYRYQICERCYKVLIYEILPALGHDAKYEYDDETHHLQCQRSACRERLSLDEDHALTIELVKKSGTGYYTYVLKYVCRICEYEKLLSDELIHIHDGAEIINKIDPTCTEVGYDYGLKCSVAGCEEILVAPAELPALGHNYVKGVCTRCYAEYYSEGLAYTLSNDETYYIVSGIGTCTDKDVYIPKKYNNLPVKSIGYQAFYQCSGLTSIEIPDSVTSIEEHAFRDCTNLTSIVIPSSVTSIDYNVFNTCSGLTNITVQEGNTVYHSAGNCLIETASKVLMAGCKNSVIPSNGSVTSIGYAAFWGCSGLTNIVIPNSVTSIGDCAFFACTSLASVVIPDSVTSIGSSAFDDTGVLQKENGVYYVDKWAVEGAYSVKQIVLRDNTVGIGDYAFAYDSYLTSVVMPNSVTSIGEYAFYRCSGLTSITIPDSVTSIDYAAFSGCLKLVEVINKSALSITAGSYDYGLVAYYAKEVHDGTTKIVNQDDYLFYTYSGVNYLLGYVGTDTALTLPENYNGQNYEIYLQAFYECSSLTSIGIPNSVTSIDQYAFFGCSSLASVVIPDSVTSIGTYAFSGCTSLASVVIPDSVTSIDQYAFYRCSGLTNITVQEGNSVYHSAGNCLIETASKNLIVGCKNSVIPSDGSVTSIGSYAFYECSGWTSIEIPNSVTSIGDDAFFYCNSLTSIVIPNSVTSIGEDAFQYCSNLTSVYYRGTLSEWSKISIDLYNSNLTSATRYYYSETEPTDTTYQYWHYVDGVATPW